MNPGEVIIIPTDTMYHLAAKLYDNKALETMRQLCPLSASTQFPVLCHRMSDLEPLVKTTIVSRALMQKLMPGPLTIIFETTDLHFKKTGERTLAVRMPNHPLALELIKEHGVLRAVDLKDKKGQTFGNLQAIEDAFGSRVSAIYPQTYDQMTITSTIVDVSSGGVKVIQEGNITKEDIIETLSDIIQFMYKDKSL